MKIKNSTHNSPIDRCNFLREEMQEEIKNLTNYHWLNWD